MKQRFLVGKMLFLFLIISMFAGCTSFSTNSSGTYAISFITPGGDNVDPLSVNIGSSVFLPSATREGYSFLGWALSNDVSSAPILGLFQPSGNLTLYAKWQVNQYTISFEENGGNEAANLTQDYGTVVSAPSASKEGNTLVGWYTDAELTVPYVFGTMPAHDLTLYAKWSVNSYTLSYVDQDGTVLKTEGFLFGADLSAATAPTEPKKTGHTFSGWDTDRPGTMPASDTTIRATYTINQYTISFDCNGGSPIDAIIQDYGTTVTAPTEPTRSGYTFGGWFCLLDGFKIYQFSSMPDNNVILFADWGTAGLAFESGDDSFSVGIGTANAATIILIPQIHDGKFVTGIINSGFSNCIELLEISIPSSVTSIGDSAFMGCSGLTSITLPSSVTSIGDYAFSNCSSLTSITIPFGVPSLGRSTFFGCSSLMSITIPDSVTSLGEWAFSGCSNLTSIIIPSCVTSIGSRAFTNCTSMTSITIPSGVTSIGDYTFYGCTGLTSVTIPSGITSIGSRAFTNCTSLTSITIPSGVTSIGDSTFNGCTGLTSVTIPTSVTYIGSYAFEGCSKLTIYCTIESQPVEWSSVWNHSNCPVIWGWVGV